MNRTTLSSLRPRFGFSLVELLAAMAVMAVLAVIVLSVLHTIRARADAVKCANNLRQIHLYMTTYAQEHGGDLPAAVDRNLGISWWLNLQLYIDEPGQVAGLGQQTVFLCPAAVNTYPNGEARRTYGMNIEGVPDWRIPVNLFQLEFPSESLLVMDAAHNAAADTGDGYFYFRLPGFQTAVGARHDDEFNALFADGHVGSLKPSDQKVDDYITNLTK